MAKTKIEWAEVSWNPITGCTKISDGCLNCYAERMAKRLKAMGQSNYKNNFKVTCHSNVLDYPLKWKKSKMIFVNSMSDLFHEKVSNNFIKKIFNIMNQADWHVFQALTKRAERLAEISNNLNWSENIWMGVTVESSKYKNRIKLLKETPAKVKFLSLEPLLDDLGDLNLEGIDWVIVGGESGPNARPMKNEWVENILVQCRKQNVPFFFKQWGAYNSKEEKVGKKKAGRIFKNQIWDEMPIEYVK